MDDKERADLAKVGKVFTESFELQVKIYELIQEFIKDKPERELYTMNALIACSSTIGRIIGEIVKKDAKDEEEAEYLINNLIQTISMPMSSEIGKIRFGDTKSTMVH